MSTPDSNYGAGQGQGLGGSFGGSQGVNLGQMQQQFGQTPGFNQLTQNLGQRPPQMGAGFPGGPPIQGISPMGRGLPPDVQAAMDRINGRIGGQVQGPQRDGILPFQTPPQMGTGFPGGAAGPTPQLAPGWVMGPNGIPVQQTRY